MRRVLRPALATAAVVGVAVLGVAACTLLTDLDGLSGGAPDPDGGAAALDGSRSDAIADSSSFDSPSDAPSDGAPVEAGPTCGVAGPTEGLLAYYAFDEAAGNTVHDCSGHGLDGTFVRQADGGSWAPGKKAGGIGVHAPNGCVDLGVPAVLQTATMTVTAWLEVATFPLSPATGYVVGQSLNADNDGWRIASSMGASGLVGWQNATGGTKYFTDAPWPGAGAWHHLVVTFVPNDHIEIFVDGASTKKLLGNAPITFANVSQRIGCRADEGNYFDGTIDELRIYDRTLTAAEITLLAAP